MLTDSEYEQISNTLTRLGGRGVLILNEEHAQKLFGAVPDLVEKFKEELKWNQGQQRTLQKHRVFEQV